MLLCWDDGNRPLADREFLASLFKVSVSTIRRHCQPVRYSQRAGHPPGSGRALYDPFAAAEELKDIAPRSAKQVAESLRRTAS